MKIVTISREFGSGGRELGKRLAELLNYDYYDHEIITAIAEQSKLDENYVERALENNIWQTMPLTFSHSFIGINTMQKVQTNLLIEQGNVIREIAKLERDFVIVGRNADIILKDKNPLSIFVCADLESKIHRCMERANKEKYPSRKEIENNIHQIDKKRMKTREMITNSKWGDCKTYQITINTTNWKIKELTPVVAEFANCWFRR